MIYNTNYLRNNIPTSEPKYNNTFNNISTTLSNTQKYVISRGISSNQTQITKDIMTKHPIDQPTQNTRITRVNVDSRYRNLESKNILNSQIFYLNLNPISIIPQNTSNTISDVVITHLNHPFQTNDHVVIQGIQANKITLESGITFIANSTYARINHKSHGINFNTTNKMFIEISNFIGNTNGGTDYNNIPINEINGLQQIYPIMNNLEIVNNDYYYINMDTVISNFSETYTLSALTLTFNDLNGVNLNLLNANYPINPLQLNGFHTIYSITKNSYSIRLNINNNINILNVGGNDIWIAKVNNFIEGYPDNNYYKIDLKKTFYNVYRIRLLSTEFPNTEKIIKSIPKDKKNNSFYWKLISDGDTLYSIELEPGNYSADLLKKKLTNAIQTVSRPCLTTININTNEYSYHTYNICSVNILSEIDLFTIEFFTTIYIPRALIFKTPNILIINHPNHRLEKNIIITIINAISTNGIPENILNSSFAIDQIIDDNTYQIILPKYQINTSDLTITNGGDTMSITFPVKSQLYFNYNDTIGNLIGFRNVTKPYSITNFTYINKNTDLYQYDIIDNENKYTNNSINLSGDNYILMSSPIFKNSYNTGSVDNVFAKLLLAGNPGTILFNQFVQLGEFFDIPISSFSQWEVYFYDPLGNLYNFGNLEHSYTLEIYELL